MKRIFYIAVLSAIILVTAPATAAVPDGTTISSDRLMPIMKWVEAATHTKMRAMPIVVASGIMLKTSLGLEGVQQARSVAAYLPGRIIINNILWDEGSARSVSYLVHEMVHHAQTLSGKKYPCKDAKEREAYMLQNRWLAEQGEDPIYEQEWIDGISSCQKS